MRLTYRKREVGNALEDGRSTDKHGRKECEVQVSTDKAEALLCVTMSVMHVGRKG